MAKKKILQDSSGQIWPVTVADCVYLTDGSKTLKKYIDDGLAGKSDTHSHPYLPTAGGTMTGNITLNNNLGLITKTANAINDTSGTAIAAGTTIKILEYNGSDNLHLGRDIYEKKLTSGATYLSGGSGMTIRTNSGAVNIKPDDTSVVTVSTSAVDVAKVIKAKGGITVTNTLYPASNGSGNVGNSTNRFAQVVAANIHAYGTNGTHYASLRTVTEGTADTQGVGRLIAGNNTNAGTAGNAKGQVLLYGTNTGYTAITPGYNSTSSVTLTLPSATGTLISNNQATFTAMPKFNMNDRNGSIFEIFGGDANGHGVRFGGGGATFIGSGESAANIITEESTSPTDEQLYVTSDNNIYFYTNCGTIANRKKVTLTTGLNFYPNSALSGSVGHADYPWLQMFADTYHVYGSAGKTYGHLNVQTVGTTSTVGETRLVLGNSTAEGTADNSWGRICLYTKSSGYTYIQPGTNTGGITLTLPTSGGTLATTANIDSKVASYLPLAGGTMSGHITLNNNIAIRTKTPAAYTNTGTNASVAAGTVYDILNYNSSGNLHIGAGLYGANLNTGSTYLSSPNNMFIRTANDGYHAFQINGSSLVTFKTDENVFSKSIKASSGIISGSNIRSDTAVTDQCGTSAVPWYSAHSRHWNLRGDDSGQTYGSLFVGTLGTTSATGESRMTVGNNLASGTANNAQGRIWMYGTNTGYTAIIPGNNSTGNIIVTLPSASGKIPLMATDDADYWGILPPTGNESTWLRSPKSGLIPFEKNSEISSLGTASWPWYNICGRNFRVYDKSGQTYGYMNIITDGTTSAQGETRLVLGNNIANGAAKNSFGKILLYGTDTGYTAITPGNNTTSNITLTLPSSGGTLARTADNVASATKLKTARTLTIGATGKTFDGSANVSWSLQDIMSGQGLNYDTACGTLYFNNAGTSHKGRISVYNNGTEDYVQLALRTSDTTVNGLQLYPSKAVIGQALQVAGNVTLNNDKDSNYQAFDAHRECSSATDSTSSTYYAVADYTYSTARFGCVNSFGGCAAIETRHNGATVSYLRVLPNDGIQLGSGKKFHIQSSAPTTNVASGDIWIDI